MGFSLLEADFALRNNCGTLSLAQTSSPMRRNLVIGPDWIKITRSDASYGVSATFDSSRARFPPFSATFGLMNGETHHKQNDVVTFRWSKSNV